MEIVARELFPKIPEGECVMVCNSFIFAETRKNYKLEKEILIPGGYCGWPGDCEIKQKYIDEYKQ